MLGEVAVNLIPEKHPVHVFSVFAFGALAVAGYAVERVGDDAIVQSLESRATSAEGDLSKLKANLAWRSFAKDKADELASFVVKRPALPGTTVVFDSVVGNAEAKKYGDELAEALSTALGMPIENPRGLSTCLECVGVWVCVNADASKNASDGGKIIRGMFEKVGVQDAKYCTDPKNGMGGPNFIKVLIGPKP